MRHLTLATLAALILAAATMSAAHAQSFNDGSNGSAGAISVTSTTTMDLPADGIINATTITVASGATLTFNRNALNTPVYLLATGDVTIAGTIDVSGGGGNNNPPIGGLGGPGGFDGGVPGNDNLSLPPGAGYGPGAGLGGDTNNDATAAGPGAYGGTAGGPSTRDGQPYGSPLLIPLVGGSGGGGTTGTPGSGGGGGGGAILIASNTRITVSGAINANGGGNATNFNGSGGSGGAIRLVAPVVAGNGNLSAQGGSGGGGGGRVRVDAQDLSQLHISINPAQSGSIGSFLLLFPDPTPELDIIQAAGQSIAAGTPNPVLVTLPFGASPNTSVVVQGSGFSGKVPIDVVLTPESGNPTVYPATIDMSTAVNGAAQVTVAVTLPVNTATHIFVWTQ